MGGVGPADGFAQQLDRCWRDDPASSTDQMVVSGSLELGNYIEGRTPVTLGFGAAE